MPAKSRQIAARHLRSLQCGAGPQVLCNCGLTCVLGPAERRCAVMNVLNIEPDAALDEQPNRGFVARKRSLMQRRRV